VVRIRILEEGGHLVCPPQSVPKGMPWACLLAILDGESGTELHSKQRTSLNNKSVLAKKKTPIHSHIWHPLF